MNIKYAILKSAGGLYLTRDRGKAADECREHVVAFWEDVMEGKQVAAGGRLSSRHRMEHSG